MKQTAKSLVGILAGLVLAQIISVVIVYLSNLDLLAKLTAVESSGFFPVPNKIIVQGLSSFVPAFGGGFFFTLTIGAGLSILTAFFAYAWHRIFRRHRLVLAIMALCWAALIFFINRPMFNPAATAYFVLIPPLVFFISQKMFSKESAGLPLFAWASFIIPVLILAALWYARYDRMLFIDIRDHVLLSNSIGNKINNAYYKYTLYPAEFIKPLYQRQINTVDLSGIKDQKIKAYLDKTLLRLDWLPTDKPPYDLRLSLSNKQFTLWHKDKAVVEANQRDFLLKTRDQLKGYSVKLDRHKSFRRAIFFSLLIGLPLTIYVLLFFMIRMVLSLVMKNNSSFLVSALLCLALGLYVFLPVAFSQKYQVDPKNISAGLRSERWQDRVATLRYIGEKRLEINDYPGYEKLIESPHIPDRYWLARAIGASQSKKAAGGLLTLLGDKSPNVVSMACWGMGQRGDRSTVNELYRVLKSSKHWYVQLYAYNALKRLGWRQKRSK